MLRQVGRNAGATTDILTGGAHNHPNPDLSADSPRRSAADGGADILR
jgi:hypothetical protein